MPILETFGLSIGYESRKGGNSIVAKGLNLSLNRGKFICLLGPNGAGKSTLIRTLAGIQPALKGEVRLSGSPIEKIAPRTRAKTISLVLTQAMPPGIFSAYSMVALGRHPHTNWNGHLTSEDREKIDWAINEVRAEKLASRQFSELSDGEKQKVMVARALAQEAPLMLLDEPTAYLDILRRVELMRTLRSLAHQQQMAILQSTHDLDLALRCADELWLFSESGDITKGTPESLALNGRMAEVFGSSELEWDLNQGSFHMHEDPCQFVRLEGNGPELLWTTRTLGRLGFGIATAGRESAFSIAIDKTGSSAVWKVSRENNQTNFESLENLTQWIEGLNS
ncbi:MAG: ABC transporter ATP-binding protein [Verrucomicrobia bacterium]|nr:ABC transporter ATP-binding protein [Verrucomicrobiota bacterium]MDA1067661.1 ABC transporter ATP-binding protein [Verrucomicrobiota bacterium]